MGFNSAFKGLIQVNATVCQQVHRTTNYVCAKLQTSKTFNLLEKCISHRTLYIYIYIYISFKMFFYVVRHLDSTASYLPTGLHLGFFRTWPSLYLPSSFSSVFLVLSFVLASTSMLFWVIFLLLFSEHGHTM